MKHLKYVTYTFLNIELILKQYYMYIIKTCCCHYVFILLYEILLHNDIMMQI